MHTNLQRLYRGVKASASGGVVPAALEVSLPRVRDRSCRRRVRLFGRSVSGGAPTSLTFHLGDLTDPFILSDFLVGTVIVAAGYAICHRCRPTGRGWARSLARDRATSKSSQSQSRRSRGVSNFQHKKFLSLRLVLLSVTSQMWVYVKGWGHVGDGGEQKKI